MTEENAMRLTSETVERSEGDKGRKFLTLLVLGFFMVVVGFILVAIAVMISQVGSPGLGGIIFIGPIPIVFGAGPGAQWLILVAVILAALGAVTFLVLRRK
jgi:uncharacterized membrane protein